MACGHVAGRHDGMNWVVMGHTKFMGWAELRLVPGCSKGKSQRYLLNFYESPFFLPEL